MKIGMIGLGKLGYPCAVACAMRGHDVMGYDINQDNMSYEPRLYRETWEDGVTDFNEYFNKGLVEVTRGNERFMLTQRFRFGSLSEVVDHAEVIFVAVQTPHEPRYEGVTPVPDERKDFDYSYLKQAIMDIAGCIKKPTVVVIISTVIPGTIRREILPLCKEHMKICYNPFFIAMGTTMRDFLNPEFVLFGVHDHEAASVAKNLYSTLHKAPFFETSIENAELIKVAYNTFIGMKIAFANTIMEICTKMPGLDVDEVTKALSLATTRLISPKYLQGGMGDGGGCHPRDNIAMSWLAQKLNLSYDFFDAIMRQREHQTYWLAWVIKQKSLEHNLPVIILGYEFKPETNITTGSPALLLKHILGKYYGINVLPGGAGGDEPAIFFIGCKHKHWGTFTFSAGSVVIDPFRYIPESKDYEVSYLGTDGDQYPWGRERFTEVGSLIALSKGSFGA